MADELKVFMIKKHPRQLIVMLVLSIFCSSILLGMPVDNQQLSPAKNTCSCQTSRNDDSPLSILDTIEEKTNIDIAVTHPLGCSSNDCSKTGCGCMLKSIPPREEMPPVVSSASGQESCSGFDTYIVIAYGADSSYLPQLLLSQTILSDTIFYELLLPPNSTKRGPPTQV